VTTSQDIARYGADGSTALGDLDTRVSLAYGRELVIHDIIARLSEEPGGLWYDSSYGAGILLLLNGPVDSVTLRRAEANAEQQCRMDERVEAARVTVTYNADAETMYLRIRLVGNDSTELDFTLTVDQVTGNLLRL